MDDILMDERFDFIPSPHKAFIRAFNEEMTGLGYTFGSKIGSGYCWGKYMLVYTRMGFKSKNVFARIYIRDADIVLRLFLNQVDNHRAYIENAPAHIQEVFCGDYGCCKHCHNEAGGVCMFRKTYTLNGRFIEKCNGSTFEFRQPSLDQLNDYMTLFREFFPQKKAQKINHSFSTSC